MVNLNGSMGMDARQQVQAQFSGPAQILISTEAGGEGINLQFCHVVVNYDVPWNPMRVEQRIGRVDRIGQAHPVRALNFLLQDTVENRVQEVLEEKLQVILKEFGVDKTGDVLDSSQAETLFDKLYIQAIIKPDKLVETVETVARLVEDQARTGLQSARVLGSQGILDPTLAQQTLENPMPYWLEKMTIQYLRCQGYFPIKDGKGWSLPVSVKKKNNKNIAQVPELAGWIRSIGKKPFVFTPQDKWATPEAERLSLDSVLLCGILQQFPVFAPGGPVPVVVMGDIPDTLRGTWSLWRISVQSAGWLAQRMLPVFISDQGRPFLPTGRSLWDKLLDQEVKVNDYLDQSLSLSAYEQGCAAAENLGKGLFAELVQFHQQQLEFDRQKGEYAFQARRRMIERLGLPSVRAYRLAQLAKEETAWTEEMRNREAIQPELTAILILQVLPISPSPDR